MRLMLAMKVLKSLPLRHFVALTLSIHSVDLSITNVFDSAYCMHEFDVAHHHNIAVKRKKRLIILMALDNLNELYTNDASDTAVLCQYLRQYTYIDYPAGDWIDKLLYTLPLHGMDQRRVDQEPDNLDNDDAFLLQ